MKFDEICETMLQHKSDLETKYMCKRLSAHPASELLAICRGCIGFSKTPGKNLSFAGCRGIIAFAEACKSKQGFCRPCCDGAEPAASSIAAGNLFKLAALVSGQPGQR